MIARDPGAQLPRLVERALNDVARRDRAGRDIDFEAAALVAHRFVHLLKPLEPCIGLGRCGDGHVQGQELDEIGEGAVSERGDVRAGAAKRGDAMAVAINCDGRLQSSALSMRSKSARNSRRRVRVRSSTAMDLSLRRAA